MKCDLCGQERELIDLSTNKLELLGFVCRECINRLPMKIKPVGERRAMIGTRKMGGKECYLMKKEY